MRPQSLATLLVASLMCAGLVANAATATDNAVVKHDYTVRYYAFIGTPPQGHADSSSVKAAFSPMQKGVATGLPDAEDAKLKTIRALLPGYKIKRLAHNNVTINAGTALTEQPDPGATVTIEKTKDATQFSMQDEMAIRPRPGDRCELIHRGNVTVAYSAQANPTKWSWNVARDIQIDRTFCIGYFILDNGDVLACFCCIEPGAAK